MGAIFGYVGFEDKNLIRKMSRFMRHRSMDGYSFYKGDGVTLGQGIFRVGDDFCPEPIVNEDGGIVLLCDGRVFRADKIRTLLESRGHEFKTGFSGEVMLHLYEEYGMGFLNRINGDFGFCLYDSGNRKLILCSDSSGSKPIYYHKNGRVLVFASDIKPILQYDALERKLDEQAITLFLTYLLLPTEKTMLQGIRRVMPSTYVVLDSGCLEAVRYSEIKENIDYAKNRDYFIKKTRLGLERAIENRIVDGVPVHASLGGLDSGSIAGILASKTDNVNTYTLGFGNEFDEFGFARSFAEHHNTNHHEMFIESKSVDRFYKEMLARFNSPSVIDMTAVTVYNIFPGLRRKRALFFSGEGADEIFGGLRNETMLRYKSFLNVPGIIKRYASYPLISSINGLDCFVGLFHLNKARFEKTRLAEYRFLLKETESLERSYANLTPTFYFDMHRMRRDPKDKGLFVFRDYLSDKGLHFINRLMKLNVEFRSYMGELMEHEILSASHGLINNSPFLDKELINFSFRVPVKYKFEKKANKILLAGATKDLFPEKGTIEKGMFAQGSMSFFNSYFAQNKSVVKNLFEKSDVFRMIEEKTLNNVIKPFSKKNGIVYPFNRGGFYRISKIHTLFSLGLWYEHYFNDEKISSFF